MRIIRQKNVVWSPPIDSYGLLPVHRAAEREGHSFLPDESAVPLPYRGRWQSRTTTCSQRASIPHSFQPTCRVPLSPRLGGGECRDTSHIVVFCSCLSPDDREPRSVSQARLVNVVCRRRGMRPVFGLTLPLAGNTSPGI